MQTSTDKQKQLELDRARNKLIEWIHLADGNTLAQLFAFVFRDSMQDVSYVKYEGNEYLSFTTTT